MTRPQSPLMIVDGSIDVTGALISACAEAGMLAERLPAILVLPRGHRIPAERTANFVDVITIPIVPLRKNVFNLIGYLPALVVGSIQLRREIRKRHCERVQLNDFYLMHGWMLRLLGFRGLILTFVRIDPRRFGLAGRLWLAAARRSSTEIVAVSRFIQNLLLPRTPSHLVYGETNVDPTPRGRPDLSRPTLLYVGNYIRGKGQEHAIAAFHLIARYYPAARLRFVGGDMGLSKNAMFRAELERLASAGPGRDRIEFFGQASDLKPYYRRAFAALNFSESESFSRTCLEASAAGLAVVATRCGGPEEIVDHERTGFLVKTGDVAAMAERMRWLFDHPAETDAMGAAGRSLIQRRFSRRKAQRAFADLFRLDAGE